MVNGIDIFREHFDNYKDQYTVIGGFACDLLMSDAGLDFRQTVDIDMVIIVKILLNVSLLCTYYCRYRESNLWNGKYRYLLV